MKSDPEILRSNPMKSNDLTHFLVINQNMAPNLISGRGAEVQDDEGRTYIDLEAGPGVSSVGHCHPKVTAAVRDQMERIIHVPGRYHSPPTLGLAKRIVELAGGALRRVFFANSGAEAADGAIKCALKYASNRAKKGFGIVSLQHSFHGRLSLPLALTGMAKQKKGMLTYGTFPGVMHAPAPYCYRCPLGLSRATCGTKCADEIGTMLDTAAHGEGVALIGEPILGVGGIIVPPDEYWPKVETICRDRGLTLIHDEVFSGFGRTGRAFAHHHYGTKPDLVCFAKAIGGGVPLGGFIASEPLGTAFEPADHFTTFGAKNMLGIAAGHAVLDILAEENLADRARERGTQFMEELLAFARRYPIIGEVRGRGLMIGVEIVKNGSKEPDAKAAKLIESELVKEGVLTSTTGVYGNNLRITPPLVISADQVDRALKMLDARSIIEAQDRTRCSSRYLLEWVCLL
jgi:4-aminobutyrate aminotransferase-like enzyme